MKKNIFVLLGMLVFLTLILGVFLIIYTSKSTNTDLQNSAIICETVKAQNNSGVNEKEKSQNNSVIIEKTIKKKVKKPVEKTITVSAAGDCTLGIDPHFPITAFDAVYNSQKNNSYFFKKVQPVLAKDDLTIVNFEGTLTDSVNRREKRFTFKGKKKYANILKEGSIEAVNLANNHTYDFGEQGYEDTKTTLRQYHIPYFGRSKVSYKKVKGVKIAMIGVCVLEGNAEGVLRAGIKQAKANQAQIIITVFHWGIEREYNPSAEQKNLAHKAVELGSDLVIGHHPHVLQGVEKYHGVTIAYSLGNFCFGGNSNPADKDTMILSETFHIKQGKLKKQRESQIIPCSLSSSSGTNNFQPVILKGASETRVRKKIAGVSKQFGTNISKKGFIQ